MADTLRSMKIVFVVDDRIKEIELEKTQMEKHNHIMNNDLDYASSITYLDDTTYKIWDRPIDPPPF